ncbi:helix-turn-helix domain-containing protein [Listeria ilorinensis]|uniref:helix-turn-helix domain-containing protein n=1 Tax=Listeria ilorinensis TaxID=2867439 RepID=UPI001EF416E3|nr:helix-turn-helix transcriptional regulator [Listeria ilorinensis]
MEITYEFLKVVGTTLKERRMRKCYTVLQLSEISGVTASYISQIENYKRENVSLSKLLEIAVALELRPSELFSPLDELPPFSSIKEEEPEYVRY